MINNLNEIRIILQVWKVGQIIAYWQICTWKKPITLDFPFTPSICPAEELWWKENGRVAKEGCWERKEKRRKREGREMRAGSDDRSQAALRILMNNDATCWHFSSSLLHPCTRSLPPFPPTSLPPLLLFLCFSAGRRVSLLACHCVVTPRPVMWLECECAIKPLTLPEDFLLPPETQVGRP